MEQTTQRISTKTLTMIGLMTAVICILGPLSVPLPITLVPITLTNFAIYLVLYILGTKKGTVCYLLYMLIGMIGLPVFSGFSGGLGKLAGPTGGFLVGFFFICVIAGPVIDRFHEMRISHMAAAFVAMVVGTAVLYAFGTAWFVFQQKTTVAAALGMCVLPFIPGDLIKIVAAMLVGPVIRGRLHKAGIVE